MEALTISKDLSLFPSESGNMSVYHKVSRKTYQLGVKEARTLLCFDGVRSVSEVQALCSWYDLEQVEALIQALIPLGFFQEHPISRKIDPTRLRLRLFNPNRLFSQHGHLTKILSRGIFLVCPSLFLIGALTLLLSFLGVLPRPDLREVLQYYSHFHTGDAVALLGLNLLFLGLHELGHAIIARFYGVNVPEIGLMLYFLLPVAYTNVSGLHLLSNSRYKLRILMAGSYVNLALMGLSFLLLYFAPSALVGAYAAASVLINLGTILLNCVIFMKFDGYYILEILLNEPDFHENALRSLRTELALLGRKHVAERREFHRMLRSQPESGLRHLCGCAYALLSVLFIPILVGSSLLSILF